MAAASKLFGFPSLTLAAVAEAFIIIKIFPDYWGTSSHLAAVGVILCINYAFGVLFWTLLHPRLFSSLRNIPGPKALVSPAHKTLVVKGRPSGDLFFDLAAKYPEQELLNLSFLGDQIAVMSPRLMSDLLVGRCYDFVKPPRFSGFLRYVLGDGLILAEGDLHKLLRKHTAPAFHYRQIKMLYSMMWVRAEILTRTLGKEKAVDNTGAVIIELGNWASKVTLDIIGIAGFGRELNTVEAQVDPLAHTYEELLDPSREKLVFATLCFILGRETVRWIPNRINKVFDDLTGHLDKLCRPFVQDKKAAMAEKKDGHFDILSLLIKSGAFTDESLKDQLLTFIAAGHETTASALTWACYLLTRRPEMQSKLRKEVENALPAENVATMPSEELASTLEGLPYLNGIMHETLRLYPTVPLTMRHAIRDTQIDSQFIPKGTDIVIPIWYINRAPEVWGTDATEFRPERWIGENGRPNANGGASSNYDLMTFLHGPRSCTGQGFAKAEMRCLLAAMVRAFEWELAMDDKEVMPRGVITIRPENGMYLKLTPRGTLG